MSRRHAFNARVANEVLGYETRERAVEGYAVDGQPVRVWEYLSPGRGRRPPAWKAVPEYSTDIGSAWEVLVHMRQQDNRTRQRFQEALIACVEQRLDRPISDHKLWEHLTPNDVCRAALRVAARERVPG